MPAALAFRYARALADLATVANAEAVTRELGAFEQALETSEDLRTAMESPAVPPPRKRAVISRLAQMLPLSDLVRRFLFVLIDHRRAGILPDVREAFEEVIDERRGVVRAQVESARPLSEAERQEIVAALTRRTGKQIRARFETRGDLIGGVVARLGSTVYDGSVRGQLDALKHRLAGAE